MTRNEGLHQDIVATVEAYFDGMMYGNRAKLETAFDKKAFIVGHFDGELSWMSRDDFADFCETEATLAEGDAYEARIESIDVTGDSAAAKVVNQELGVWYTDYLSLLKTEGRWRIVNKVYFAHPKT